MKGLGVHAGVSDLIFLHQSRAFALELKAGERRETPAQLAFKEAFNKAGGSAEIARGLDQALSILEGWRLLRETTQVVQR